MKKSVLAIMVAILLTFSIGVAYADNDLIQLFLNGGNTQISTVIIDNRAYVPVRALAEQLGMNVEWNEKTRSILITSSSPSPSPSLSPTPTPTILPTKTINNDIIEKINMTIKSCVLIYIYNDEGVKIASGSGFVVDKNTVLTCFHVINGVIPANVKIFDNNLKSYNVSNVTMFPVEDVAVLTTTFDAPSIFLADSSKIKNGEIVYTIASPKGLNNSVTRGIISRVLRDISGEKLIQFDAPISGGSSGGLLMNIQGEAVGMINGMIKDGQGLNFAIPSNIIKQLTNINPQGGDTNG